MLKHFFLIARLYFVFLFFGLSSLPQHVGAETCIDVQDTSGIPTPVYIDSDGSLYMLEPAFEDYSYMLYDACFAWDIPLESGCSIYPMMGAINRNALAEVRGGPSFSTSLQPC